MVPKGWDVKNLKDVTLKIQDGNYGAKYPKADELVDKGIPFLTSKALGGSGKTNPEKYDFITIEKHIELKKAHITTNDILFTNRGANVGVIGIAGEDLSDANIGPQLTLIRSNEKLVSYNYLYFFMKSSFFQRQVQGQDSGSAMNFFGIKSTEQFKIKVPPLSEQQKIAKILSTWDKAISTTERLIENSIQQKKALMQQLLTGKKRLLDESGKRFEGEWKVVKLQSVLDLMRSGLSRKLENDNVGIAVIRSNNMGSKYTNNVDLKYWYLDDPQGANVSNYILDDGDLLVNFINSLSQIGKACIYRKNLDVDAIYTTNILRIKPNTDKVDPIYLYLLTQTANYDSYITSITKPAVNQASFTTKEFGNLEFNLPSLKEQQKIATVLINADKEIELLEQQLADLQQEKKALMQVLLTGKVRVVVE